MSRWKRFKLTLWFMFNVDPKEYSDFLEETKEAINEKD